MWLVSRGSDRLKRHSSMQISAGRLRPRDVIGSKLGIGGRSSRRAFLRVVVESVSARSTHAHACFFAEKHTRDDRWKWEHYRESRKRALSSSSKGEDRSIDA